jgi:hypothetical protein
MTRRLEWPEDGTPLPLEDLGKVLRAAFIQAVEVKDVKSVRWMGPEKFSATISAASLPPSAKMSREGLQKAKDNNLDALDMLILTALQCGIEQGRRMMATDNQRMRDFFAKVLREKLDDTGKVALDAILSQFKP